LNLDHTQPQRPHRLTDLFIIYNNSTAGYEIDSEEIQFLFPLPPYLPKSHKIEDLILFQLSWNRREDIIRNVSHKLTLVFQDVPLVTVVSRTEQ
jgi:hypothetical protein